MKLPLKAALDLAGCASADERLAQQLVRDASRIVILTGAGVSAESGIPTFRSADGLWHRQRPEELATPAAFEQNPRVVWEWYAWRRRLVLGCCPNDAHLAIARLCRQHTAALLITQNVDGLHGAAMQAVVLESATRSHPAGPLELHGSLFRLRCTRCQQSYEDRSPETGTAAVPLPVCRSCGDLVRPDVVWFGEVLDAQKLHQAVEAARSAALMIVVGTSGTVQPAAGLALLTSRLGGDLLEVNTEPTPLTAAATVSLHAPAAALLPWLLHLEGGTDAGRLGGTAAN